jgi:hypothetical protein
VDFDIIDQLLIRFFAFIRLGVQWDKTSCLVICCLKRKNYNIQNYNFACCCETLSLTLREEHGLRVLRIFGQKRDKVT